MPAASASAAQGAAAAIKAKLLMGEVVFVAIGAAGVSGRSRRSEPGIAAG